MVLFHTKLICIYFLSMHTLQEKHSKLSLLTAVSLSEFVFLT